MAFKFLREMSEWARDYHYAEYFNQGTESVDPPTEWEDDDEVFFWQAYRVIENHYHETDKTPPSADRIQRMLWKRPAIITEFRAHCVKGYQGSPVYME